MAAWIGTDGVYAVPRGADGEVTAPRRILVRVRDTRSPGVEVRAGVAFPP